MEGVAEKKRILILCHSRTGGAARLARRAKKTLSLMGHEVSVFPVEPLFDLPYPLWLLLSFIPGAIFPVKPLYFGGQKPDAAVIVFPKWGYANPLFNYFAPLGRILPPTALIVSYGGWRGEGFLRRAKEEIEGRGTKILGAILVKRRDPAEEEREVDEFLAKIFP